MTYLPGAEAEVTGSPLVTDVVSPVPGRPFAGRVAFVRARQLGERDIYAAVFDRHRPRLEVVLSATICAYAKLRDIPEDGN